MDIEAISELLGEAIKRASANAEAVMSSGADMSNPEVALQLQFAMQKYSMLIDTSSSVQKLLKDLISGILQKIS